MAPNTALWWAAAREPVEGLEGGFFGGEERGRQFTGNDAFGAEAERCDDFED